MTRRRAFGSVRELDSGRWQARYLVGPPTNRQQRKAPHTFAQKADAHRFLVEVEHAISSGSWRPADERTVLEYATECIEQKDIAVRTREQFQDTLRLHIAPQLGSFRVTELTPADVRLWNTGRLAATGRTPAAQAYRLLRNVMNLAVGDEMITSNPCRIKGADDPRTPERPYMSREQAAQLIDALPHCLRAPATVTVLCHLRLGELLGLQRGDIEGTTIHVRRSVVRTSAGPLIKSTKTGDARAVEMPPETVAAIRAHLAVTGPGLPSAQLFTHPSGRPLARQHVQEGWRQARVLAGYPQFHWHDLRHAGLTWASEAGASLRENMHRAGHKSMRAAMTYQHRAESRDQEIASRLRLRPEEHRKHG